MPGYSKLRDVLGDLRSYRAMAVGATHAVSADFPEFLASAAPRPVAPRDPDHYDYLGYTVTRPDQGSVLFGLAYDSREGCGCREDLYAVNIDTGETRYYERGRYERIDPRYKGTHHGDKSYLRND
jgi:hypothetical protein